ncbi:alpha/beta hydrolase [Pseudoalteromonas sp. JBTF-M23]|uniref:Alpha/beta hydrolase n=1 Tax=Pseudoalteromonas caenipelagi TaxID=2726988 RepID=A0A849VBY3_9GAMM|nr:alpha/beta hydrolase-fold protein [Pseudoalteromonas caenipelagi]NOU50300.1 alpha/beta hydrolase [Pseudoalteromonas caenipelagi]
MKIFILLFALVLSSVSYAKSERFVIKSAIIDESPTIQVSLPDTYSLSNSSSYPVLVVLDGSTQFQHIAAGNQFLSTYAIAPEMIVVSVSTLKRMLYFTPTEHEQFAGRSGKAHLFKDFLNKELLPKLQEKYRVAPYYMITGHSLAGLFTSYLALEKSSLFNAHISISPSFWWDDKALVKHYAGMKRDHLTSPKRWFLSIANEPGEMSESYQAMLEALEANKIDNLHWFSKSFPEDTHDSTPLVGNATALKTIFNDWNAVPEIDVMPLKELRQYYKSIVADYDYEFKLSLHQYNVYGLKAAYEGKTNWGVEILEQGVKDFPKSEILWDSLATAYELDDKINQALSASKLALELAQRNDSIFTSEITSQNKYLNSINASK